MSTVTQKTYPVTPEGTAKLMRLLDDIGIPYQDLGSMWGLNVKVAYRSFHAMREEIHLRGTGHDLDGDVGNVVTFRCGSMWVFPSKELQLILPFVKGGVKIT